MTRLHLDYETKSEIDLLRQGIDLYAGSKTTGVLMASFRINDEATQQWVPAEGERMPVDLKEGLRDPEVLKVAFNAQFERHITTRVLGLETELTSWRCSMALAYMFSFMGGLEDIGNQMDLKTRKATRGRQLIGIFCQPNKPTKNQPFVWRDQHSDPELWEEFKQYNITDTDTEHELWTKLISYGVPDWQWSAYHLDQIINDRGLPINRNFVEQALIIAERRKKDLIAQQNQITGLSNSNSGTQLLPWLQDQGYPFHDLQKGTFEKVLGIEEDAVRGDGPLDPIIVSLGLAGNHFQSATLDSLGQVVGDALLTHTGRVVMRMRQASSKTSTTKYAACMDGLGHDDRLRHCFQFAGGSRTNRFAGRKIQPQNLPRTPKWLEPYDEKPWFDFDPLDYCNSLIAAGDYETLGVWAGEQMDAVAGCVRSAIQAPDGKKLVVCDLSSIESVVIGWLTGCKRLLDVFWSGKDAYKDFATELYQISYDLVTKTQRTNAKPATLGAGYRLSGGEMKEGKKTGLWGYAENMKIILTREECHRAVAIFRETYHEIPSAWYAIENAIVNAAQAGGRAVKWGLVEFEVKKPFLRVKLPSGRYMYYYKLTVEKVEAISRKGNTYDKYIISYMGKDQVTNRWQRIESHGGKFIENLVQAIARDILVFGMLEAHEAGMNIVLHVHDEIGCEQDENDLINTVELLRACMTTRLLEKYPWMKDIPLGAAGYEAKVYRKD